VVGVAPPGTVGSGRELRNAIPGMRSFGISFAVIGIFWLSHHAMFRYITAVGRRLILLNLLFLGTIAFLPYPTELLSSGNQAPAVIFYAACCSAAGLAEAACWLYATRPGADLAAPAAAPALATYLWILIWIAGLAVSRLAPLGDTRAEIG
jgi:uncharacterized membrane protein